MLVSIDYIFLANPDADIAAISLGLRHVGRALTHIELSGCHNAQRVVSDASMGSLCDVIRDRTSILEVIRLRSLIINEGTLVTLVETCRGIMTMSEIE